MTIRRITTETVKVRDAAKILGVSAGTAYESIRRGQLPAIRLGKRLVVPVAALERMLSDAGQVEGGTPNSTTSRGD